MSVLGLSEDMDNLLGIEIFSSSYICHGLSLTSVREQ
jgi:hypothetical protein